MKRTMLFLALLAVLAIPASSDLAEYVRPSGGGSPKPSRWNASAFRITWSLNPKTGSNIQGTRSVADVIQASFNTWTSAPNTALPITRGADTSASSAGFDGINLICFVCSGDFSKEPETLAVTITTTADAPGQSDQHGGASTFVGQIMDADTLFNPATTFATSATDGQDLQTVATHELGHFLGLDHSAVVRALMYPFAPTVEQTLSYDDVAGISALYPKSSPDVPTFSVSGVVRMNGSPVLGAHVYVDSETAAEPFGAFGVRKSPIGTLSFPDGTYTITGVPADSYTVLAEPLDQPVTNSDVSDFAPAFGQASVQTNFTTRWH